LADRRMDSMKRLQVSHHHRRYQSEKCPPDF